MTVKGEGIKLVATWFPPIVEDDSTRLRKANAAKKQGQEVAIDKEPGKTTSPFILVHDWGRNRGDLLALGKYLQSQGHAVIIPDLRGHGQSLDVLGLDKKLDHRDFRKSEKASAVGDIDQCKRFLQEKNNEGVLNIDLLNVVAVGDSAHLAIAWTVTDWSWRPVAGIKQGQDVKSLILFSPSDNFAGSSLRKLAKEPLVSGKNVTPLPMLVIWGKQSDTANDCSRFIDSIRKFRPAAPAEDDLATRWAKQSLFDLEAPTAMKGYELAGNPQAKQIWDFANNFVSQKVIAFKEQCPWQIRGADCGFERLGEGPNPQTGQVDGQHAGPALDEVPWKWSRRRARGRACASSH